MSQQQHPVADQAPVTPYNNTGVEKTEVQHYEQYAHSESDREKIGETDAEEGMMKDIDTGLDPVMIKKLVRKIDWRIIPVLSLMYAISLIDRTNLAIARAANDNYMNKELGLATTDPRYPNNRYSIITLIFFVPVSYFGLSHP